MVQLHYYDIIIIKIILVILEKIFIMHQHLSKKMSNIYILINIIIFTIYITPHLAHYSIIDKPWNLIKFTIKEIYNDIKM